MKFLIATIMICASFSTFASEKKDRAAINSLIKAANLISSVDLSCSSNADCKSIAVGSRACGGPASFIVVSENNQNMDEISYLAKQSEMKEAAFNLRYAVFSICSIATQPAPNCSNKICR